MSIEQDGVELYFRDISQCSVLCQDEQKQLVAAAQSGDVQARGALIESNVALVVSIAKKYQYQGVDFLDLIQAGNVGLAGKAIEKYNPDKISPHTGKSSAFTSCATWWIRQGVSGLVKKEGKITRLLVEGSGAKQVDDIADPNTDPKKIYEDTELQEKLVAILQELDDRQREIIILKFVKSYSSEEIGQKYGLTRQRINQILKEIYQTIRESSKSERLRDYLDN